MHHLIINFIIAMGINLLMFIPAYKFKTDKLTDISYSVTFVVLGIFGLMLSNLMLPQIILFLMILLWAMRLGGYLLTRIQKIGKDNRFDSMRSSIIKFGSFWVLQGFTVFVVLIPGSYFFNADSSQLTLLSFIGIAVWLLGLIIETIADYQKTTFIKQVANKGKWVNIGLWKHSRHPNYLGEILVWIGVYLFILPALNTAQALIGAISPVFIAFLLLYVSGIPLLEKSANKKWADNYAYTKYKLNTGKLLPKNTWPLIISMGITLMIGMIGGLFTSSSVGTWYVEINKPEWNPPNWIFGPVWTTLYILMGIAIFLIWKKRAQYSIALAMSFYVIQLLLNLLWSLLFFGLQNPQLAFFEVLILLSAIVITTVKFWKISKAAAILMIPYILWVSFASLLNFSIWQLNL